MEKGEILTKVDHTCLKPTATWQDIQTLCEEAIQHKTASVCIPPAYLKRARAAFPNLNLCTVIGFPLGYNTMASKVFETKDALEQGADEIDMVVNLGDVKNGDFDAVTEEIKAVRKAAGEHVLKVIIETCYLTQEEKIQLCDCVTQAKADYIKTSTGFGTAGAQLEDIQLFREHIGKDVKIKAAGGIRTREAMEAFCRAGCDRIGCSAAVKVLCAEESAEK
ncbi:deoxyribose-phosphate aldolase [uncultured Ruthenibacterium sp.]|uniref:deoxyribose-phosphate aldolase n=1 Tax=uncultured Ruthenibacterium sp. TaxID=1905347 RepID=UPI00349EF20F